MIFKKSNSFNVLLSTEISRRSFIIGTSLAFPALNMAGLSACAGEIGFVPIPENQNDTVTVPLNYEWHALCSWGDPLFEDIEDAKIQEGAPFNLCRSEQEMRFGTNNDMFALFPKKYQYPWPKTAQDWIICSNNESIQSRLITTSSQPNSQEIEGMYAAMGVSICEVKHDANVGSWKIVKNKTKGAGLNRRLTPFSEMVFDGPAKNHKRVLDGARITNSFEAAAGFRPKNKDGVLCGTLQNCAGGFTPWGTYLTAEENIDNNFFISDTNSKKLSEARGQPGYEFEEDSFWFGNRFKFGGPDQFDLARNPNSTALYGWVVEIDPYDPNWTPRKRTALGRKKNECATCVISNTKNAVIYMGDDQNNEFVYKFVSNGKFDPTNRVKNRDLLSNGRLYAARFNEDGSGVWLEINLQNANKAPKAMADTSFADLGDVMLRAREAARRLGATQMDRPEDVESPTDGSFIGRGDVYIVCTGNQSKDGLVGNVANPRRLNPNGQEELNYTGHIIRIHEAAKDHAASRFTWETFLMGGDHSGETVMINRIVDDETPVNLSSWKNGKQITKGDRFAMPDNITFDMSGNAFFTTDGTPDNFRCNDGIYVVATSGAQERVVKRFLTGPIGCEITGPLLSPDNRTFFCGLQHIGSDDIDGNSFKGGTTPPSTFPNDTWPRDTIVYVRRKDGGIIGT